MSKPLSDGAQRLVFGVLIVALVSFGIYWSLGGGSDTSDPEQQEQVAEGGRTETLEEGGEDQPVEPLPTVAAEDMALADWLPFSEEEFIAAAAVAQEFATDYGTIDYSKSPQEYYDRLGEHATKEYARTLAQSSGAEALWGERAEQKATSTGRAVVKSIRGFDDESIVFILKVQSITESDDGKAQNLGDFAVTMVKEGGSWRVYDFQPADAGNLGGG
ncbi:hypothetical protein JCM3263A_05490 [Thermobifida fusca]|jgi:hypothetical protein|uniref:Uncharacterized protein n=2 Tax=Thermobifida fusca TaxID=2021 RepID=A0A9P2TDC1_THEFU|nr:hypothetical protein [Thermobifida fusca]AAZ54517.1 hypothetical protein Tfu_0479 [Thermobifida fusca YX]EOR72404.1 hypothetical protein TM51_02753 [Thermobifida fusca TM51]MDD6790768.1 hypothetical protein [Thermobifida fusca]QOS60058.1 hypothetical protein IM867_06710 [Thermobifida fusca]